MNVHHSFSSIQNIKTDLAIFFCFEESFLKDPAFQEMDQELSGWLKKTIKTDGFLGKKSQSLMLPVYGKLGMNRILLLGMGSSKLVQATDFRLAMVRAIRMIGSMPIGRMAVIVPKDKKWIDSSCIQFLTEGAWLGSYRFDKYLTGDKKRPMLLQEVALCFLTSEFAKFPKAVVEEQMMRGKVIASSVIKARDFTNEPASEMTPERLAKEAQKIGKTSSHLTLEILSAKQCEALGMGLLMAVAKGSELPPCFIHLAYHPSKKTTKGTKRIALVGKGITFDSGGLAIKTPQGMMDMKSDMSGGAVVLATMDAIAQLGCRHEVHAFIACAENMISGKAYRLRDVITSMSGKTVEITNTDAEGRLTLSDSITYALQKVKPNEVIDIATLTGACVVALGPYMAGVMGNNQKLIGELLASAQDVGEEMWPLPIPDFTIDNLKSDVADLKNAGDRNGGALTAARFIKEFVGDVPWAHIDAAGPSFLDKDWGHLCKGGTGFGVATLVQYLTSP